MITAVRFPPIIPRSVDLQSAVFVLLVLVIMPLGAVRSKAIVAGERGHRPPDRSTVLMRACLVQLVLFAISYVVARTHDMGLWTWTGLRVTNVLIAAGALAL